MRRSAFASAVFIFSVVGLIGCSAGPSVKPEAMPAQVDDSRTSSSTFSMIDPPPPQDVVLETAEDDRYFWRSRYWTIEELEIFLKEEDQRFPVGTVVLVSGTRASSIADVIRMKNLADVLGAKSFLVGKNGEAQEIQSIE